MSFDLRSLRDICFRLLTMHEYDPNLRPPLSSAIWKLLDELTLGQSAQQCAHIIQLLKLVEESSENTH